MKTCSKPLYEGKCVGGPDHGQYIKSYALKYLTYTVGEEPKFYEDKLADISGPNVKTHVYQHETICIRNKYFGVWLHEDIKNMTDTIDYVLTDFLEGDLR